MRAEEIVPGTSYRKGKTVRRVLALTNQNKVAFLVEVKRNERGAVVSHGKTLVDPIVVVPQMDEKGHLLDNWLSVDGKAARPCAENEGIRYRWEGGTVVYCPEGSAGSAKEMTRQAFAEWAEQRVG